MRCDEDNSVQSLMLSSNNLKGTVPTEIYYLKSLSTLSLNKNEVSISFKGIDNAEKLRSLDLSATGLSSITGISNAHSLVDLHLEQNSFSGPIPNELVCIYTFFSSLRYFFLLNTYYFLSSTFQI